MNMHEQNLARMLFSKGVLNILTDEKPIRGIQTKSPLYFDTEVMIQPHILSNIAQAMAYMVPENTTAVAGINLGTLLAYEIAKIRRLKLLTPRTGVKMCSLKGERITYITDFLSTGLKTAEAIHEIANAGGACQRIFSVFDYNFHLNTKGLRNIEKKTLINIEHVLTLEDSELQISLVQDWAGKNEHLFGDGNRIKVETEESILN